MIAARIGVLTVFLIAVTVGTTPTARAEDFADARVSYDAGAGLIRGMDDEAWSHATINTVVLAGDMLWVDSNGFLEIEMAGGSFVRMADGSKAKVISLAPTAAIQGWTGSFYVHRLERSTGDVFFETPACTVDVEKDSLVRVDIVGNGATTVTVRWGCAVVRTQNGGRTFLQANRRSYIDSGLLPSTAVLVTDYQEDEFDTWSRERSVILTTPPSFTTIPNSGAAPVGYLDLGLYGEWVYIEGSPYWRPTVVVDYVPYRNGHWSYVTNCGYVWVGSDPFSYVTTHYGRWMYDSHYGWVWVYRDGWGPAWVATVHSGPHFIWTPLDPWDRPVSLSTTISYSVGGVLFSLGATSFCYADELVVGPCPVYVCTPPIVNIINVHEVTIWNIYAPSYRSRHRPVWDAGPASEVRDYSPRRVIRGPDTVGPDRDTAETRAVQLESERGGAAYAAHAVKPSPVRTPLQEDRRSARIRLVRVDEPRLPPRNRDGREPASAPTQYTPPTQVNENRTRTERTPSTPPAPQPTEPQAPREKPNRFERRDQIPATPEPAPETPPAPEDTHSPRTTTRPAPQPSPEPGRTPVPAPKPSRQEPDTDRGSRVRTTPQVTPQPPAEPESTPRSTTPDNDRGARTHFLAPSIRESERIADRTFAANRTEAQPAPARTLPPAVSAPSATVTPAPERDERFSRRIDARPMVNLPVPEPPVRVDASPAPTAVRTPKVSEETDESRDRKEPGATSHATRSARSR